MAIGDLDSGARFGLPPIGLPQAHLDTPGSDTERRAMPGLATKNSVFSWVGTPITIVSRSLVTGNFTDNINLRNNTTTGGVSMDVPTWAAGAHVQLNYGIGAMGTSTAHNWGVSCPVIGGGTTYVFGIRKDVMVFGPPVQQDTISVIVPFFDEPIVTISYFTDGTGTSSYSARVIGFVRNV